MRIILFGCNGQVGWDLQRSLMPLGELFSYDKQAANFEYLNKIKNLIKAIQPDIIVNAAAYTAVNKAEEEPQKARQVNAKAVEFLAEASKKLNALLIHYSTDYVFNGKKEGLYTEEDLPNPLNVYGKTKLEGEQAIEASECKHMIFRTSWVYSTHGHNFIKTMMKLFREKKQLSIVSDQFGAPTSASLIADITALTLYRYLYLNYTNEATNNFGTYNLVASGETTWYDFACFILERLTPYQFSEMIEEKNIIPVVSKNYQSVAKRPTNGRLSTKKLTQMLGLFLPHWKVTVKRTIHELIRGIIDES